MRNIRGVASVGARGEKLGASISRGPARWKRQEGERERAKESRTRGYIPARLGGGWTKLLDFQLAPPRARWLVSSSNFTYAERRVYRAAAAGPGEGTSSRRRRIYVDSRTSPASGINVFLFFTLSTFYVARARAMLPIFSPLYFYPLLNLYKLS